MTAVVADSDAGMPISDAADHLGIHPRTLRRYISEGRIEAVRYTSQVVRIHEDAIEEFLDGYMPVETGTGTCYVPRLVPRPKRKTAKGKARKAAGKRPVKTW